MRFKNWEDFTEKHPDVSAAMIENYDIDFCSSFKNAVESGANISGQKMLSARKFMPSLVPFAKGDHFILPLSLKYNTKNQYVFACSKIDLLGRFEFDGEIIEEVLPESIRNRLAAGNEINLVARCEVRWFKRNYAGVRVRWVEEIKKTSVRKKVEEKLLVNLLKLDFYDEVSVDEVEDVFDQLVKGEETVTIKTESPDYPDELEEWGSDDIYFPTKKKFEKKTHPGDELFPELEKTDEPEKPKEGRAALLPSFKGIEF